MSFKFIKGSVQFTSNKRLYKFEGIDIINEGIPEICAYSVTYDFALDTYFTLKVKPDVTFKEIEIEAQFFVSADVNGRFFGIKFLDPNHRELGEILSKHGKEFTKWKRSTPRIPSSYFTGSVGMLSVKIKTPDMTGYQVTNLLNVSLGGIGIFGKIEETKNYRINNILLFNVTSPNLENPVSFTARIMRITTSSEFRMGKFILFNHIGLKFVEFDEDNKKKFLELVKTVIEEVQKKG